MRSRSLLGQRLLCAVAVCELHLKGGGLPGVSPGGEDAARLLPLRPGAETSTRLRRLLQPRAPCPPWVQGQRGQRGQQTLQQGERGASGAVGGTGPPRPHRGGGGSQRDGAPEAPQTGRREPAGRDAADPWREEAVAPERPWRRPVGADTRGRARLRSRVAVDVRVGPVVWLGRGRLQQGVRGHLGARCGESTVKRPTLGPTGSPGVAVSARARGDRFCKDMGPARHLGVGRFFLRSRGAACEAVFGKCEDPEGRPSWQGSRLG